ncbi:sensor histidine kinase [Streptomyces sp. WG5]|uniref:sensor histidine kinase n=1 Tax=Streptomyces sp. WG5 TaxID=3417648 RepID=UPI003CF2B9B8
MHRWQAVRRRTESHLRVLGSERPFALRGDLVLLLMLLVPSAFTMEALVTTPAGWLTACVVVTAAVVVQRTAPLLSLLFAALLTLFYPWFGASLWPTVAAAVLSCLAGRRLARIWPAHLVFVCVAAAGLPTAGAFADTKDWLSLLMTEFIACVLPWWAGNWWSQRTALAHAGWEHAEQLEWRQRYIADQARLKERARIAQDIHDSLGHELSVMALLAGGLELAPGLSEQHRASAGQLRERCTMATERLHEVIGLLREDPTPSLTPAHETIAQLVRRFQQSGTPVEFHEDAVPARRGTPLLSDLAAYRVAQEALTNAAKHAPGAPITVRVTHTADETVVSVVNERLAQDRGASAVGSGFGLIGLDERVRLAGGTLRTGFRPGGFEVRARLPCTASAPSRSAEPPGAGAGGPYSDEHDGTGTGSSAPGDDAGSAADGAPTAHPAPWGSASRTALLRTRARLRRDARRAALIPVVLGAALVTFLVGLYVFTAATTSVAPEDYARIRVGETRAELAPMLPTRRIRKPPPVTSEPPVPAGAGCEYYRASSSLLDFTDTMYRLCFENDVLTAKDTL